MDLHGAKEPGISNSFYVWCAVGAAAGGLAGVVMGSKAKTQRLEEILVGVFGAFVGGEGVASALAQGKAEPAFSLAALGGALGSAIVLLVLLSWMRGAVGPLRSGKSPGARRR